MIKIVCGVFGHYIDGKVVAKDKNSEPFALPPEMEAELVAKKIAVYVDKAVDDVENEEGSEVDAPIGFDELPEDVIPIPEYSINMKAAELREIGKLCGLEFEEGMTKAKMVAVLDKHIEENTVDGDEEEDEDDAPAFDPADAVVN